MKLLKSLALIFVTAGSGGNTTSSGKTTAKAHHYETQTHKT